MKKLIVISAILLVAGCAAIPYQPYAREVKRKPTEGGVIALRSEHRAEDRQKADMLMMSNCGESKIAKVMEEGETIIGEKTNTSSNKTNRDQYESGFSIGGISFSNGNTVPGENTNSVSETSQLKEWRIIYNCESIKTPDAEKKRSRR